ncbi:MAG: apolipoprotein N-acyltransferase, partial [Bacteroidales bacterium]|nr:apolipoprotein N-acyltransferase [Bacteroidales bacterium]
VFCIISLGWIRVVSIVAAVGVIVVVSFLMAFVLWAAFGIRQVAGRAAGNLSVIAFWLAFELLCLKFDLFSPWVNLGNGLAKDIMFIQWYEITGTSGGTLWILLSNLLLSSALAGSFIHGKKMILPFTIWTAVIILPVSISLHRFFTIEPADSAASEILIIQPNFDPYTQKFSMPFEKQVEIVVSMAGRETTAKTRWIITPETTVDDPVNEKSISTNRYVKMMRSLAVDNPRVAVVTGMVTFVPYSPDAWAMYQADDQIESPGLHYEIFNSALMIDTGKPVGIYHKSKLVAGFETSFSPAAARVLRRLLPQLGGTNRNYGTQDERISFEHPVTRDRSAPVICFESVYGSHVADYVKLGANMLFIITNDGWWKNSSGYKQHLSYASLRAIETRRPVARSANTGISCFIDLKGVITKRTGWWSAETIRGDLVPESRITPYVRYGDYILYAGLLISISVVLFALILNPLRKRRSIIRDIISDC